MQETAVHFKRSLQEIPSYINHRGIETREVINEESVLVLNLLMKGDDQITLHATPVDIVFNVLKGKGLIEIGENMYSVSQGDILFCPRFVPHGVYTTGEELELLIIKTPNPIANC